MDSTRKPSPLSLCAIRSAASGSDDPLRTWTFTSFVISLTSDLASSVEDCVGLGVGDGSGVGVATTTSVGVGEGEGDALTAEAGGGRTSGAPAQSTTKTMPAPTASAITAHGTNQAMRLRR